MAPTSYVNVAGGTPDVDWAKLDFIFKAVCLAAWLVYLFCYYAGREVIAHERGHSLAAVNQRAHLLPRWSPYFDPFQPVYRRLDAIAQALRIPDVPTPPPSPIQPGCGGDAPWAHDPWHCPQVPKARAILDGRRPGLVPSAPPSPHAESAGRSSSSPASTPPRSSRWAGIAATDVWAALMTFSGSSSMPPSPSPSPSPRAPVDPYPHATEVRPCMADM